MEDIKVKVLVKISEVLAASLNVEKTLSSILKILSESLEMQRGTIALVNPATNELRIEVAQGLTKEEKERGRYKIGEGVTGRVVESGEAMVVPDIEADPLFLNRTRARKNLQERKFAFLCVPIKVGNKAIGALSVDHLFSRNISYEEDIKLLTIVAAMVGQAVKIRDIAESEKKAVELENIKLRQQLMGKFKFGNIIYSSPLMEEVLKSAEQVAQSQANVLLLGESGTGKELVASAIHFSSPRSDKPFIKVACAALPENLLESELFGYEKGAFTGAFDRRIGRFELANGGSIFLDEIGDLSLATQVKLLRVIQEREFERVGGASTVKVDVRVICATHRDLDAMVKEGKFRQDLYYRINVFPIHLPPLRERKEDIPLLAVNFIHKYNKLNKKNIEEISRSALDIILGYNWPGNVRELENVIERAVILCPKEMILPKHLSSNLVLGGADIKVEGSSLKEVVESIEQQKIKDALSKYKTQRSTARALGLTERILGYKIKKYKIV